METVFSLLGSISKQTRGVSWQLTGPSIRVIPSNSTHLIIPPPSISFLFFSPFIPPLTNGYLTAKTNCLVVGIHNSSYTLLRHKSTALLRHTNMEKLCKPWDNIQTCGGRSFIDWEREENLQDDIYMDIVLSNLHMCSFWRKMHTRRLWLLRYSGLSRGLEVQSQSPPFHVPKCPKILNPWQQCVRDVW